MPVAIDPQLFPARPVVGEEGVMLTHAREAGLVAMPWNLKDIVLTGSSGYSHVYAENRDGSYSGVFFNMAVGLTAGTLEWGQYGTAVGIRFNGAYMANQKSTGILSLQVDGVVYPIYPYPIQPDTGAAWAIPDGSQQFVVHDLPDIWHRCIFQAPTPPTGSPNTAARALGYLADRASGYSEQPRLGIIESFHTIVSNTAGSPDVLDSFLDSGSLGGALRARGLRQFEFYNTDTAAQHVYIQTLSGATWTTVWEGNLAAAGTVGSTLTYPQVPMGDWMVGSLYTTIGFYASAASKIILTVVKAG